MDELIKAALAARQRAYAPYSGYQVGAAVRDESGRIHPAANVENISYGVTLCAERGAVSRLIAEGGQRLTEVAVATRDGGTPCGICLQTLFEFATDPENVKVDVVSESGAIHTWQLSELMPQAFRSGEVGRTKMP